MINVRFWNTIIALILCASTECCEAKTLHLEDAHWHEWALIVVALGIAIASFVLGAKWNSHALHIIGGFATLSLGLLFVSLKWKPDKCFNVIESEDGHCYEGLSTEKTKYWITCGLVAFLMVAAFTIFSIAAGFEFSGADISNTEGSTDPTKTTIEQAIAEHSDHAHNISHAGAENVLENHQDIDAVLKELEKVSAEETAKIIEEEDLDVATETQVDLTGYRNDTQSGASEIHNRAINVIRENVKIDTDLIENTKVGDRINLLDLFKPIETPVPPVVTIPVPPVPVAAATRRLASRAPHGCAIFLLMLAPMIFYLSRRCLKPSHIRSRRTTLHSVRVE